MNKNKNEDESETKIVPLSSMEDCMLKGPPQGSVIPEEKRLKNKEEKTMENIKKNQVRVFIDKDLVADAEAHQKKNGVKEKGVKRRLRKRKSADDSLKANETDKKENSHAKTKEKLKPSKPPKLQALRRRVYDGIRSTPR